MDGHCLCAPCLFQWPQRRRCARRRASIRSPGAHVPGLQERAARSGTRDSVGRRQVRHGLAQSRADLVGNCRSTLLNLEKAQIFFISTPYRVDTKLVVIQDTNHKTASLPRPTNWPPLPYRTARPGPPMVSIFLGAPRVEKTCPLVKIKEQFGGMSFDLVARRRHPDARTRKGRSQRTGIHDFRIQS